MAEPVFAKVGMYIMAPEPIFINPYHQSVCICEAHIVVIQRLGINPLPLLGNGSVEKRYHGNE
jgi:hypothetical protein